jgi:hypothetical protein
VGHQVEVDLKVLHLKQEIHIIQEAQVMDQVPAVLELVLEQAAEE